MYERLFQLVVKRVNTAVEANVTKGSKQMAMSVIDIYGFEVFGVNRWAANDMLDTESYKCIS